MAAVRRRTTDDGDGPCDEGTRRHEAEALGDALPAVVQQRQSSLALLQGRDPSRPEGKLSGPGDRVSAGVAWNAVMQGAPAYTIVFKLGPGRV